MSETTPEKNEKHGFKEHISGLGQKIIGEIEEIGGVLTGDPATRAEGELNVELGDIREGLEEQIDDEAADR